MNKLLLNKPVTITGKDVMGRHSSITFTPSTRPGWFWNFYGDYKVPINLELAEYNPWLRYILLRWGRHKLRIWEHIGILRFTGIDQIEVSCPTGWPPYFGRTWEMYERLLPHLEDSSEKVGWWRLAHRGEWEYTKGRLGSTRLVPLQDYASDKITVCAAIDYDGMGVFGNHFTLSSEDSTASPAFEKVMHAHAQGWPPFRRRIASAALSLLLGAPLLKTVTWPQDHSPEEALGLFWLHRVGDLLGALSLLDHERLPALFAFSDCSGHEADLLSMRRATGRVPYAEGKGEGEEGEPYAPSAPEPVLQPA